MPHPAIGRALAVAAVLASVGAGAQTMYKWVDEKGVTHFSEHPPPDERKASKVTPKVTPPSTPQGASSEGSQSWQAKDAEFRKRQIERGTRDKAEAKDEAKRQAACDRARSRLAFLQNSGRIFRDHPDGSRTFMDEWQRDAEIARAKDAAGEACR